MQILEPSERLFSNMLYLWCFIPIVLLILFLVIRNKGIEYKLRTIIRLLLLFCLVINIGMACFGTFQYVNHPPIEYNQTELKGNFGTIKMADIKQIKMISIHTPQFFINPGNSLKAYMLEIKLEDKLEAKNVYISENAYPSLKELYTFLRKQEADKATPK